MNIIMKKIEAIVRSEKLEEIKDGLLKVGVRGMTISQVLGVGNQKGHKEFYRGAEVTINLLQKIKIEIVANDEHLDDIIKTISACAKTGEIGDGKIFVYNIENVIRIRTGESGEKAI
jgi:nitrogen regulatory protein P-II 1